MTTNSNHPLRNFSLSSDLKPGDTAVVIYSCYEVNLGKIVKILRPQQESDEPYLHDSLGTKFWHVRCEDYFYSSTLDEQHFWVLQELVMPECCLQKLW